MIRLASCDIFGFLWHASNMEWGIYGLKGKERREETTGGAQPKRACIHISTGKWSCRRTEGKVSSYTWGFVLQLSTATSSPSPSSSLDPQEPLQLRAELGTPVSSIQPPGVLWGCMLPTPGPSTALSCSVSSPPPPPWPWPQGWPSSLEPPAPSCHPKPSCAWWSSWRWQIRSAQKTQRRNRRLWTSPWPSRTPL